MTAESLLSGITMNSTELCKMYESEKSKAVAFEAALMKYVEKYGYMEGVVVPPEKTKEELKIGGDNL
jgi:hypothetical protein